MIRNIFRILLNESCNSLIKGQIIKTWAKNLNRHFFQGEHTNARKRDDINILSTRIKIKTTP